MRFFLRRMAIVAVLALATFCAAAPTEHYSAAQRKIREPMPEPETTEYYIAEPTNTLTLETPPSLVPSNDTVYFIVRQSPAYFDTDAFQAGLAEALGVPESDIEIGDIEDAGDGSANVAVTLAPEAYDALRETNPAELSGIGVEQYSFMDTVVNYCLDNPCAGNQTCVSGPDGAECRPNAAPAGSTSTAEAAPGSETPEPTETESETSEPTSTETETSEPSTTESEVPETTSGETETETETSVTATETESLQTETTASTTVESETGTSATGSETPQTEIETETTATATAESTPEPTTTETESASETGTSEIPTEGEATTTETAATATATTASTEGPILALGSETPFEVPTTTSAAETPTGSETPFEVPTTTSAAETPTETPALATSTETGPVIPPLPPIVLPPVTPSPEVDCSSFKDCESCTNANCKFQPTSPAQCTALCLIADLACYSQAPDGTNNCAAASTATPPFFSTPPPAESSPSPTATATATPTPEPRCKDLKSCDECTAKACWWQDQIGCFDLSECNPETDLKCYNGTQTCATPAPSAAAAVPTSEFAGRELPLATSVPLSCSSFAVASELFDTSMCGSTLVGATCDVKCAAGYVGETSQLTCVQTGAAAQWSGSMPSCQVPPSCGALVASSDHVDTSSCGSAPQRSTCEVKCGGGYQGTPAQFVCLQAGATAVWTGVMPTCQAPPSCEPLAAPSELFDTGSCGTAFTQGTCQVKCAAGYAGAPSEFKCTQNGATAQWSGNMPSCKVLLCGGLAPTAPNTDTSLCSFGVVGDQCPVRCSYGYLGDPAMYTCSDVDGTAQWIGIPPTCSA